MANPRKFSEKIALHNHRQAEETAAFNQIMKEVNEVTTKEEVPHLNKAPPYRHEGRSRDRTQAGPIRRPHDRRFDTSPYSSGTYLTLPTDTGWRRTNSDSALHQSTMQGSIDRSHDVSNRGWNMPMMNGPDRNPIERSRSNPRVPGISIHPTGHDPSMMQIPLQNTGSLPDLTNVDFSSPIHTPLDQDHNGSPYSSSPVNTSPSTLSPTSIHQGVRPQDRFHFTPVSHAHSNHLSVPLSNRYQQQHHNMNKNIQLDKNMVNLVETDFTLQDLTGMYQQCPPTSPSPTLQQTANFRSPRPSPQSSPSPVGRNSAPCSPGVPSPLPNDYHIMNQQAQFQQHFAKLSVFDPPSPVVAYTDPTNSAAPPLMSQSHTASGAPPPLTDLNNVGNVEMTSDPGYYSTSPSQLVYPSTSPRHHTTTPNTPTSLPEIILTDFSADDGTRQESFPNFFSEDALKEDLGELDFTGYELLDSATIGIPESVEDDFRLDHRS